MSHGNHERNTEHQSSNEANQKKKTLTKVVVSSLGIVAGIAALLANLSTIKQSIDGFMNPDSVEFSINMISEKDVEKDGEGKEIETFAEDNQYKVKYTSELAEDMLSISYSTEYFDKNAKHVGILGEGPFFDLPKVGIDFKIVNNSKKSIYITDAELQVISSRADNRPLMAFTQNDMITGEIEFSNDGWGDASSMTLHARIKNSESEDFIELPYREIDHVDGQLKSYRFDIAPLLEPFDIPTENIKKAVALTDKGDDEGAMALWKTIQPKCMNAFKSEYLLEDYGFLDVNGDKQIADDEWGMFFYNCTAQVEGYLEITWNDESQSEKSQRIDFNTFVYVTPAEGLGADGFDPTGHYDAEFRIEGENYITKPEKSFSQPIEAGKFDRFVIWLGAPQSSSHQFIVRLKYNNGEWSSQTIDLKYLMPKTNRQRLN